MKHIIFIVLLSLTSVAFAQEELEQPETQESQEAPELDVPSAGEPATTPDDIEGLFNEDASQPEASEPVPPVAEVEPKESAKDKEPEPEEISDLKKLETFADIAVIQKRYLPKTGRFEFYVGGGTNLNDAFFVGNGVSARLGYNFKEKWGVEGIYSYIQNDNRDVTNELLKRGVNTEGSVSTNGYYGVDLKWTPIYGKYAYFNEKIIPFDLYFTLGVGKTDPKFVNSSAQNSRQIDVVSPYTVRVGTGQIFAITKWMAFRWDIAMHFIAADTTTTITTGTQTSKTTNSEMNNNLFLNIGLSFFFPEANYR